MVEEEHISERGMHKIRPKYRGTLNQQGAEKNVRQKEVLIVLQSRTIEKGKSKTWRVK